MSKSEYSYGGTSVDFWEITGHAANSSKRSETHVSGSGDHIRSSTRTKHEFWLIKDDGTEVPIQLTGYDIPIRNGQEISAIAAGVNGSKRGPVVAIVNHSARRADRVKSKKYIRKNMNLGVNPKYAWIFLGVSFLFPLLGAALEGVIPILQNEIAPITFIATTLLALVYLPCNIRRHFAISSAFYDDIQWIAENVLEGNKDVLKGPTKGNRARSRSVGGSIFMSLASFFIAGLGQLLQGRLGSAVIHVVVWVAIWVVSSGTMEWVVVVHIYSAYDAATWSE